MLKSASTTRPITLRERLVLPKLAQVEEALVTREDELQTLLRRGLSPAKIDQRQFELDALRDLKANLSNQLEMIALQNEAARSAYSYDPLTGEIEDEPEEKIGSYRTKKAYFDNLQRERDKNSKLSRTQFEFAKATAAKRFKKSRDPFSGIDPGVNLSSEDIIREEHPTWFTTNARVRSYMYAKETLTGIDPCVEIRKKRREVMFAQRTAGIGYRTRHERKPC